MQGKQQTLVKCRFYAVKLRRLLLLHKSQVRTPILLVTTTWWPSKAQYSYNLAVCTIPSSPLPVSFPAPTM